MKPPEMILGTVGLALLAASAWTVDTTLGLAASGLALLVVEWRHAQDS